MAFPPDFIEKVRDASDILEVVSQYVTMRKRGSNYFGLCPFHNDKTPSFSVAPAKGIFHCFGCGTGGNVISFIMEKEKLPFAEAVEFLARRANLEIPRVETRDFSQRERLFKAALEGHKFFLHQFRKSDLPKQYLQTRKFELNLAEKMELGFAPDLWDSFSKTIKGHHQDYVATGLIREREKGGGYYDYFRHRLMFPIKDLAGRVCAFGGRILGADDEHNPKYLNSPETAIFSKGSMLYGLGQNREAIRQSGFVYLVEGYIDLLRLISCGIANSAAGLGTAFTPQQAKLLKRYTEKVTLLYDGDQAGSNAAIKAGRILSSVGLLIEIIPLPEGQDPDTFLRDKDPQQLQKLPHFSLLQFQFHLSQDRISDRQERGKLAREMLESVALLPQETARMLALEEVSELIKLPVTSLRAELRNLRYNMESEDETVRTEKLTFAPEETVERDLLRLLISTPEVAETVFTAFNPEVFQHPTFQKIFRGIKSLWLQGHLINPHGILNQFEEPLIKNFITECALWEKEENEIELIEGYSKKFSSRLLKSERTRIQQQILSAQSRGEDVSELLKKLQSLK
jgi:DNA primase